MATYTITVPDDLDFAVGLACAAKAAGIGLPNPTELVGYTKTQFLSDFITANAQQWKKRMIKTGQISGVPLAVPRAAAKLVLLRHNLKATVEGAINSLAEPAKSETLLWYNESNYFERYHPAVLGMQAAFLAAGDARWTDAFMDALWVEADAISTSGGA